MQKPTLAEALFTPRTIALIGASDTPGANNARTQIYLKKHGYPGTVYPVNPRRETVHGVKCYPSVTDIPEPVDHAFITTPPAIVPRVIRECGEAGVTVATVFTSDFAESGAEGAKLQDELIEAAKQGGVRLIGPNCMGVYNTDPPAPIAPNTVLQLQALIKGNIGVISHSGSLTGTFISRGQARGLGFSKIVSIGNESDISVAEIGEILVDDPKTEAILLFLETIRSADAFAAMARRAYEKGKPVIAYKLGRSEAAQEFTASHTGAIAGTDSAVDAFFRHHGIIRVNLFETLFELPMLLLGRDPKPGNSVSVLSTTGGGGGMVVDCLGTNGIETLPIPEDRAARLHEQGGIFSNGPLIDLTFNGAKADNVTLVLKELLAMPESGGVVMVVGSSAQFNPENAVKPFLELSAVRKPIGAFLVPQAEETNRLLTDAGVAAFRTPESCADAFRCCLGWTPPTVDAGSPAFDPGRVGKVLNDAGSGTLDEWQSNAVFEALGIPQAAAAVAPDASKALAAAETVGFPLVAKIISGDIPHKTEAGGVELGIRDSDGLATALERIKARVAEHSPQAKIDGFLLQRMESGLAELLLGYRVDSLVGPTVVLGTGG
ncbi:MAG: acetate--CoA ligase family protein, partial [Alphaproteobacteria bacterium]|nr:acetate--CoA ligase family protein [Alphaproteobacteria bacterium]